MDKVSLIFIALIYLLSPACTTHSLADTEHYQELIAELPHDRASNVDWDFLLSDEKDLGEIEASAFRLLTLESPRFDKRSFLFEKTKDGGTLEYREAAYLEHGQRRKVRFEEKLILDEKVWEQVESCFDKFDLNGLEPFNVDPTQSASLFILEAEQAAHEDASAGALKSIIRNSSAGSHQAQRIADELTSIYYGQTKRK